MPTDVDLNAAGPRRARAGWQRGPSARRSVRPQGFAAAQAGGEEST